MIRISNFSTMRQPTIENVWPAIPPRQSRNPQSLHNRLPPPKRRLRRLFSRNLEACPVATTKCVTCHLPKVNVAVMHSDFTDHRIRIVRKGEPYPN